MGDLRRDPFCGARIPKTLWPIEYVKRYRINNLWKYNLPNAWRLVYTVKGSEVEILAVFIEWMSHTEYERRFGYRAR